MKKIISFFTLCALLLTASLLFSSCDAPGVYLIDELLPPLTEKATGYAVTTSILVTRLSTNESVEFTEPTELDVFHQRLEGVKCIRDKNLDGYLKRYAITFFTSDSAVTLYIVSDKDFIFEDYHYEAMRGGIDTVYLDSLFPPIPEIVPATGEAPDAEP